MDPKPGSKTTEVFIIGSLAAALATQLTLEPEPNVRVAIVAGMTILGSVYGLIRTLAKRGGGAS